MNSNEIDPSECAARTALQRVTVWDFPTRLVHWLLVAFVGTSFVTAEIGGNAMQVHEWSGFVILSLLLFRVGWGFFGSKPSRFSDFVCGPKAVLSYARGLLRKDSPPHFGHNPLGGWSIVAMLLALFVQAGTGLFANDDILTEGPLYSWVSKSTSDFITDIHEWNQGVIVALVVIHLFAILFYFFVKRENLVSPMITGVRSWNDTVVEPYGRNWTAAVIAGIAGLVVYLLVR
ncbi:MAG: cytochrome b/b6 domain-containing protein [Desulfobacterales bacterium]